MLLALVRGPCAAHARLMRCLCAAHDWRGLCAADAADAVHAPARSCTCAARAFLLDSYR